MVHGDRIHFCGINHGKRHAADGEDVSPDVPDLWDGGFAGTNCRRH